MAYSQKIKALYTIMSCGEISSTKKTQKLAIYIKFDIIYFKNWCGLKP